MPTDDEVWLADPLPAPADPWAGSTAGAELPTVEIWLDESPDPTLIESAPQTRTQALKLHGAKLYGVVYCCQTKVDANKYVGKSGPRKSRDGRRVPCSPGVRVDEHRDSKSWGREILPGRAGYRVLEWVTESGRGADYDEANLRYREALWISRLKPTENGVRPLPVPPEEVLARKARKAAPASARVATPTRMPVRRRSFAWFRTVSFAFWCAIYMGGLGWLFTLTDREPAWLSWSVVPGVGMVAAWSSLWSVRRCWDRITRPASRPPAKARRRRSR